MPSSSAYIPSFSISNFAQSVSAPYTSFGAYASGVIDANGNLLKPESSIDPYEYFVIKLKKIFEELPTNYTKARLNSYMSPFQIFNEESEFLGIPKEHFLMFVEGYLEGGLLLNEDMGAGMATGGSPGSLGTAQVVPNTGTVMGYDKPMDLPLFRRSPVEMFDVDHNEFQNFKNAKAWKHIPDSPTKKYLKRFQQRNPNGKMAIRTKKPDTDEHDLYWITYPAKNFMEEYGLEGLDILNEKKDIQVVDLDNDGDTDTTDVLVGLENDVSNPHHVKKMAAGHLSNLSKIMSSETGNESLKGNAAAHEVRTRMAMAAIGMHEADLDNSGSNSGVDQAYFQRISNPRYVNKSINNSGPDFIPYAQRARRPASSAWDFFGGESKYRPSGRVLIPTKPLLAAIPTELDREIAKTTFEGGHGLSTIRPSGQSKKLFDLLTQDPVKNLMTSSAETEISRGQVPHSLQVQGAYTPRLIHGTGIEDMAQHFATHRSSHGNVGVRSIRPTKTPSKVQTEFGEVKFPAQMEFVLGRINPKQQKEIVVDDTHLGFLRNKMLGTSPSEEHKAEVDSIMGGWASELEKGGFYKRNRQVNPRAPRISEVL